MDFIEFNKYFKSLMVKTNQSKNANNHRFVIDCTQPVEDSVIVVSDFKDFL